MDIFLTTERLTLTTPHLNDIDDVLKLQSDSDVMKYIGDGARSETNVKNFLDLAIVHFTKHGFGFC